MTLLLLPLVSILAAADPSLIDQRPSLHVTGIAQGSVAPDKIDIAVTVTTETESIETAMAANETKLKAALAAARALGIAQADLQLTSVSVSARELYEPDGRPKGTRQVVSKGLVVCLRTPAKLDALLVDLSKAKVHVGSIEFSSSRLEALNDELQVKAVQNAKKRAEAMAAPTGSKVGRALKIRDANAPGARNQSMEMYSSGGGASTGNSATGALSVVRMVDVDFELVDPPAK